MDARITDSELYGHLFGTDELRAIFGERARLQTWLDILVVLAEVQAQLDIIPAEAAAGIARGGSVERLDLAFVAAETRRTGHSTLGLIHGLQRVLPPDASEWVYYGVTVQDLTDTWTALAIKRVGAVVSRDLRVVERHLLDLAQRERNTLMPGRTHGQPGAAITFGFKAAGWADEVRRHLERLRQGAPRWLVGQLAGAVGTLAFFGEKGLDLRKRFCQRLGLSDPGISWLSSRDRLAEFVHLLAMVTSTLGRIGNEVYQLQRPEIAELREPAGPERVGSMTMPHKRNPEVAEHLVTLSRLVRAQAAVVLEGMVQEHERDGRSWKAEWVAFPEACLLAGAALAFAKELLSGLEVKQTAMAKNLEASRGYFASEQVLALIAPKVGKHRAQALLQEALQSGRERGVLIEDALRDTEGLLSHLDPERLRQAVLVPDAGLAGAMVDEVVRRATEARTAEPDAWT